MSERRFGHIPGYPVGSRFDYRDEMSKAGVHRPRIAGISGNGRDGADSVVLAGGYDDGEDYGDLILYTGHGGRDLQARQQVRGQALTRGNLALARSRLHGLPVRVMRGAGFRSTYAPDYGYRYDGLYRVTDYWRGTGRAGFFIWRFRLVKMDDDWGRQAAAVRERTHAKHLHELYHFRCQICDTRLRGSAGPYAETVYLRPREAPHNGPETPDNMLCVCPNCRVLLDIGGLGIADDHRLIGRDGVLHVDFRHRIDRKHLQYRRRHYPVDPHAEHDA